MSFMKSTINKTGEATEKYQDKIHQVQAKKQLQLTACQKKEPTNGKKTLFA